MSLIGVRHAFFLGRLSFGPPFELVLLSRLNGASSTLVELQILQGRIRPRTGFGRRPRIEPFHLFKCSTQTFVPQIEVHPGWRNDDLISHAHANGIVPTAYFPLGGARPDCEKLWEVGALSLEIDLGAFWC